MSAGHYRDLFSVKGKVVFCAGGVGAIGGEMAKALAAYGARVAIADISQEASSAAAAQLAEESGCEAMGVAIDVLDAASVAQGAAAVERKLGPIDVLINTVGTHVEQAAEDVTLDAWDKVVGVNLRGAFILSQSDSLGGQVPQ